MTRAAAPIELRLRENFISCRTPRRLRQVQLRLKYADGRRAEWLRAGDWRGAIERHCVGLKQEDLRNHRDVAQNPTYLCERFPTSSPCSRQGPVTQPKSSTSLLQRVRRSARPIWLAQS